MSSQVVRTYTLLETLLDYLPGPQMIRSQADAASAPLGRAKGRDEWLYTAAEIDRQIAHLEAQERARRNDHSRGREAWESARIEQYRQGDYAALDAALARLESVNATHWRLAWRVATHHPGVLDRGLRIELVCAVRWLGARLPEPARVPEWTRSSAAPSAAQVAALRELGVPMRVLLRVYGGGAVAARKNRRSLQPSTTP